MVTQDYATLCYLALASFLIGYNWYHYVLAMITGQVLQSSLGYFMTPIMSIFFGVFLLRERLNRPQWVALTLGILAAVLQAIKTGQIPHLALVLSSTFAFYGYIKKRVQVSADVALGLETLLLLPPLAIYFLIQGFPQHDMRTWILLILSGPLTVMPMIWFTLAVQRISLTAVAFLQYLSPVIQFVLAIFIYKEPFKFAHMVTFFITWIALAIFMWDLWRRSYGSSKITNTLP